MSLFKTEAALIQAYQGAGLSLPTEYENAEFERPEKNGSYASVFFSPNQPSVSGLGNTGADEVDGFLQIDLYTERNSGTAEARNLTDTLRNTFQAGTRFSYDGQGVLIRSCGRNQGRVIDGYFMISITIYWRTYINRSL